MEIWSFLYNMYMNYEWLLKRTKHVCTTFVKISVIFFLAGSFFETGAMAAPTKLRNSIILSQAVQASTQRSQPRRFCHWRHSFGNNGYPPIKSTAQN